jgi:hypothetical protein
MLKKLLKLIKCSCVSNCSYNNSVFESEHLDRKISDYKLKNKDIEKILMILQKRKLKEQKTYI